MTLVKINSGDNRNRIFFFVPMINDLKFIYLGRNLSSSPKTIQDNRLGENFCLAYLSFFIFYPFVCHYYTFEWKNTSSTLIISLKFYADFACSKGKLL